MHYTVQAHFYSVDEKNDQANSRFLCFNDVIFYNIITGFHLNTCCHNHFAFFLFCVLCNDIYDTSARTFSLKVWCRRSNNLATSEITNMARQLYTLREVKKAILIQIWVQTCQTNHVLARIWGGLRAYVVNAK